MPNLHATGNTKKEKYRSQKNYWKNDSQNFFPFL